MSRLDALLLSAVAVVNPLSVALIAGAGLRRLGVRRRDLDTAQIPTSSSDQDASNASGPTGWLSDRRTARETPTAEQLMAEDWDSTVAR